MQYTKEHILRIAKRFQNKKRTYLLVNPLQAKHMPCSPSVSLQMMRTFGNRLANAYPNTKLIISFAETATAIGTAVASCFANDCVYIQTTREDVKDVQTWIDFLEEHSHATEQKLCADHLQQWLEQTETVIFVEDEISTGKTLVNMVTQLKEAYPILAEKQLIAASILNRVSAKNQIRMEQAGMQCAYVLKLPEVDYTAVLADMQVTEAQKAEKRECVFTKQVLSCDALCNPRKGIAIKEYMKNCVQMANTVVTEVLPKTTETSNVLVLGTEECMFPALCLGEVLEKQHLQWNVQCHATTRSPIGICTQQGYPITTGSKLQSFYAKNRDTYLYNVGEYDMVIVVSDTKVQNLQAFQNLMGVFSQNRKRKFYYIQGGKNVWYI